MIVNIHEESRLGTLLPGVIAKGLAQRMTADVGVQTCGCCGFFNDSISLISAQGLSFLLLTGEEP